MIQSVKFFGKIAEKTFLRTVGKTFNQAKGTTAFIVGSTFADAMLTTNPNSKNVNEKNKETAPLIDNKNTYPLYNYYNVRY